MTITTGTDACRRARDAGLIGLAILMSFGVSSAAHGGGANPGRFCSSTARLLLNSCRFEVRDDWNKELAICFNHKDDEERSDCLVEGGAARVEARELCGDQHDARLELCEVFGEDQYDPDFDAEDFEDDFADPATTNLYYPLGIGYRWEYQAGTETIEIEVRNETKSIEDVTCIVLRDIVRDDGRLVEDTDDWIALHESGDAWYCGEEVKDYEYFEGDEPSVAELVSIDGSFKTGREGDKPGIRFPAAPVEGQLFRQEFSLGNAEDVVEVLETDYEYGDDTELDALVPEELADHFCDDGGCVVVRDSTPLEPGAFEQKYYAPGIGVFLETNPESGKVTRLVDCSFDPRCAALP